MTPADDGGGGDVSCLSQRSALDLLSDGARIFLINVLGRDMNVFQRGLDVGMAHEFHQGRQTDTRTDQVDSKCVSKSVWVGLGDMSKFAVMAEQGAQSRGRDAHSPGGAFEIDEQRRTALRGPL